MIKIEDYDFSKEPITHLINLIKKYVKYNSDEDAIKYAMSVLDLISPSSTEISYKQMKDRLIEILDDLKKEGFAFYICNCCGKWKCALERNGMCIEYSEEEKGNVESEIFHKSITEEERKLVFAVHTIISILHYDFAIDYKAYYVDDELITRFETNTGEQREFVNKIQSTNGTTLEEDMVSKFIESLENTGAYHKSREVVLEYLKSYESEFEVTAQQIVSNLIFATFLEVATIIKIDSALDFVITDTDISETDKLRIPYKLMFIDKVFKVSDNRYISDIGIYDNAFLVDLLKKQTVSIGGGSIEKCKIRLEDVQIESNFVEYLTAEQLGKKNAFRINLDKNCDDTVIAFSYFIVEKSGYVRSWVRISLKYLKAFLHDKNTQKLSDFDSYFKEIASFDSDEKGLLRTALKYVFNVCNLMSSYVNLKFPASHGNDYRLIPYYPDKKSKRAKTNRFSILKVFGITKQYVDNYNRERRKYNKTCLDAVLVRGHWRHLQSERYREKRGETIWIAPYIKGTDKELYSRIIKVKP